MRRTASSAARPLANASPCRALSSDATHVSSASRVGLRAARVLVARGACPTASCANVVASVIGGTTAPVAASGSWPAWIARGLEPVAGRSRLRPRPRGTTARRSASARRSDDRRRAPAPTGPARGTRRRVRPARRCRSSAWAGSSRRRSAGRARRRRGTSDPSARARAACRRPPWPPAAAPCVTLTTTCDTPVSCMTSIASRDALVGQHEHEIRQAAALRPEHVGRRAGPRRGGSPCRTSTRRRRSS